LRASFRHAVSFLSGRGGARKARPLPLQQLIHSNFRAGVPTFKVDHTVQRLMTRFPASIWPQLAVASVSHLFLSLSVSVCVCLCVCVCVTAQRGKSAVGRIRLNDNWWPAKKVHWLALHADNWPVTSQSSSRVCAMLASWTNEPCCVCVCVCV